MQILHAAPHASDAPDVWPLLFVASALFAGVALAGLLRARARWLPAVALLLFAAAVLTTVVPVDHLISAAGEPASGEVHVVHCHDAPGSCSQLPVSSGPGQFLTADPLLAAPALLAVLIAVATLPLAGLSRKPDVRPPLLAAVA